MTDYSGDKQFQFAKRLWEADSAYRGQLEHIRLMTRQRQTLEYTLNGKSKSVAPTPRALAEVTMLTAMVLPVPRIQVPPVQQNKTEDEKKNQVQRFLHGVRRATRYGGIHPDDEFWFNYAEGGRGIMQLQFDSEAAKAGIFPFRRKAHDPMNFTFKASENGLICAVVVQERDTLEVYDELQGVYAKAAQAADPESPEWSIPQTLQDCYTEYDSHKIKVTRFWDKEREYMWVEDEPVWKYQGQAGRPHLMRRVPFDVGFCMNAGSERLEELGIGIVKSVLGNLENESKMLDKAYLGFEFFYMPLVSVMETSGRLFFEQVVPGGQGYQNVQQHAIIQPAPNAQIMEQLISHNDSEVTRATFPEMQFGMGQMGGVRTAGYAIAQMLAGSNARIDKLLESGNDCYKSHFNLMLNCIEHLANAESAKPFVGKNKEQLANWLNSFTTFSPMKSLPDADILSAVTLGSADVKGYQVVELDFKPEPPTDENAKMQRAQLAKASNMPQQYVDREILKVESPEQVEMWRHEEALMAEDPDWKAKMLEVWKKDILDKDKQLAKEFQEQELAALPPQMELMVRALMKEGMTFAEAMQQVQQMQSAQGQPPAGAPTDLSQGQAPQPGAPPAPTGAPAPQNVPAGFVPPAMQGQSPMPPQAQQAMQTAGGVVPR